MNEQEQSQEQKGSGAWKVWALLIICIAFCFLRFGANRSHDSSNDWKDSLKNFKQRDMEAEARYNAEKERFIIALDSLIALKEMYNQVENQKEHIKTTANETRNNVAALPADKQLQFFASWVSQLDTL